MDHRIKELISKLNRQQCTEEEIDLLLKNFNSLDREELAKEMEKEWQREEFEAISAFKKSRIWEKIKAASTKETAGPAHILAPEISRREKKDRRKRKMDFLLKFAAVFIGLAVISVFTLRNRFGQPAPSDAITVEFGDGILESLEDNEAEALEQKGVVFEENKLIYPESDSVTGKLVFHTIRIPHGRKFQVVLSDGTKVFLNSGSTFRYPVNFQKGKSRMVYLEGEAFFKVSKRAEQKFLVLSRKLETEVLGTEFNISAHKGDAKIEIVLVEGSIRVNGEKTVTLKPDEKLTVTGDSADFQVETVDAEEYIEWIYGIIWFKDESFREIVPKLERQFDVEIDNDFRELEDKRFTGRFETEGLKEILDVFKMATDFRYQISEKEIHIDKPAQ